MVMAKRKLSSLVVCVEFYVEDLMARGRAVATCRTNEYLLNAFVKWCLTQGIKRLSQLDLDVLEDYRRHLHKYRKEKDGEPLTMATQRMRLMSVTGMLKRLHLLNKTNQDFYQAFELPKVKKAKLLDVPDEEQMLQMITQTYVRAEIGIRDRAILWLYYAGGLRRAELANLDRRDINFKQKEVKVRKGKGFQDRVVPVADVALDAITEYLEQVRPGMVILEAGDALFLGMTGKRIQKSAVSDLVSYYFDRSGIGIKGSCHKIRHASATHMLQNGADIRYIQEFLGHEHLISTQIYTHVYKEDLKRVYNNTHPAARS